MGAYWKAVYEIPHIGDKREANGSVRHLVSDGVLTREGRRRPLSERKRMMRQREGEISQPKPAAGTFRMDPGVCEVCGEEFVGPPNKRKCGACGGRKRGGVSDKGRL